MALTTYERIKGALAGVGNAGDRILKDLTYLRAMERHIPEGTERQLFNVLLKGIEAQAEQLKTVGDD